MRVTTNRFQVGCQCCEELLPCDPNVSVSDSTINYTSLCPALCGDINLFLRVMTNFSPNDIECPESFPNEYLLYFQSVDGSLVTFRRHDESDGIEVEAKANRTGSGTVTFELRYLRADNTITGKGFLLEKIGSQWYYDPARSCNDPTNCADIDFDAFHTLRVFPAADLATRTVAITFSGCADAPVNATFTLGNADLFTSASVDGYVIGATYSKTIFTLGNAAVNMTTAFGAVVYSATARSISSGGCSSTTSGSIPPDPRSPWSHVFDGGPGMGVTVTVATT